MFCTHEVARPRRRVTAPDRQFWRAVSSGGRWYSRHWVHGLVDHSSRFDGSGIAAFAHARGFEHPEQPVPSSVVERDPMFVCNVAYGLEYRGLGSGVLSERSFETVRTPSTALHLREITAVDVKPTGQRTMRVVDRMDHFCAKSKDLSGPNDSGIDLCQTVSGTLEEPIELFPRIHADDGPHPMVMGLGPNAGWPQNAQDRQMLRREQHVAVAPDLGTEPRVDGSPVTHSFCNNGLHCVNRIGRSRRRLTSQSEGVSIEHETAPMLEPTSAASYPIGARIMPALRSLWKRVPARR
jgi:hypothetical protein